MAIKKVLDSGKIKYEVIVKVRDKSGRQKMRRRRWFNNERDAKKAEFELLSELQGSKDQLTWKNWISYVMEKYRLEYRNSTYLNYKHMMKKWFDRINLFNSAFSPNLCVLY